MDKWRAIDMDEHSITAVIFRNGLLVDGSDPKPSGQVDVLVENGRIVTVSSERIESDGAVEIDLAGKTIMPGLIDCHMHPFLTDMNLMKLEDTPVSLVTAQASVVLNRLLDRGFTTIRDAAGGDWGLKQAVDDGLIAGPRLFISGRALSQTGGHGDFRRRTDDSTMCSCSSALHLTSRIADGVDQVRHAVRDELRKGADQIKIMVSGGVSSPFDPLEGCQFSMSEIEAAVDEATRAGTYVLAHAYSAEAITRALTAGVRTIEHANLIDAEAAELAAKKGAFVVPTLVAYEAGARHAESAGYSDAMLDKLKRVREFGLRSLEICKAAGVKMGFGTDIIGDQELHTQEFLLRAEVLPAHEIIASATRIGAEILRREGDLGVIAPGATADILVIDGNPLEDISLLAGHGEHLRAIMKDGRFHKNNL
jgi:imidazolonepropionase-like amidohydrolase